MEHEMILAAYRSFNAGDIEPVLALTCEDVDWANGLTGDRLKGRKELRSHWNLLATSLSISVEPVRIYEEGGDTTVVVVRELMRERNGRVLMEREMEQVYTLRDGLIAHMDFRALPDSRKR